MLRTTKNELLIGFTISVILSLFANFALIMQHYELEQTHRPVMLPLNREKSNCGFLYYGFSSFLLCYSFFADGYID